MWTDFQKPWLEYDRQSLTSTYGRFVAEPFERGFGTTIGNALRRIMLSSLPGAAITAVKIEGVYHEFASLPGVAEDVSDILLNLKEVRFRMEGEGPKTLRFKAKGPTTIKAGDIKEDGNIQILNGDAHIAKLNKEGKLEAELIVKKGRGYVPAERIIEEELDPQFIPIDAIFSPIRRVNFRVEDTRVGRSTDYDKLIFEVWTDGSVTPEDTLAYAAKILREHLQIFISFEEEEPEPDPVPMDEKKIRMAENLKKSVDELELSVRSYNCLKNASIQTIADLVQKTDKEMLETRNFGRKSLNEIKEILEEMGLTLGMNFKDLDREELVRS
jgi:DNA-directed RNA polymerase subunit alpha